ncbi:hypothetical protein PLICRDRAFT_38335 [Plicaturopsis crispa FD-325 SS-3]|nr:hypothetical protein PLICRDRAFT_38335 [Plicaturopsis crispa FD-325 SS-3]
MQRRVGNKGLAHISPPTPTGPGPMRPLSEKQSRLSQRTFGVTHRIWLILALLVAVLTITRLVLPSHSSASQHRPLVAKNYYAAVNGTPAENPFPFCPELGQGDELAAKYGARALLQSRLHLGSGERVQRVIRKALAGEAVTISVLGGSVSACHGAASTALSPPCYPTRFFDWFTALFPHPGSEVTNGALRRTRADYFAFCSAQHLPDHVDMVILEFDADDGVDKTSLEAFEQLVRALLIRPEHPAVVILGHFAPQMHTTHGFAGPEAQHAVVAQFYDVPHISTKPLVYPAYINDPASTTHYYADPVLATADGHALLADVLISYLQSQICTAFSAGPLPPSSTALLTSGLFGGVHHKAAGSLPQNPLNSDDTSPVPPSRINTRPSEFAIEEIQPYCASAHDLINPLPPSLFYGSGWQAMHPSTSPDEARVYDWYWHANQPTSRLRVPIVIGAGDVAVYFLREPMDGEHGIGEGSAVECWVDDNYPGAVVIENAANVAEIVPTLEIIDRGVARGSHYVECMLIGEEGVSVPPFKILGIFAS